MCATMIFWTTGFMYYVDMTTRDVIQLDSHQPEKYIPWLKLYVGALVFVLFAFVLIGSAGYCIFSKNK
jgi:hypothetical protein